MCSALLGRYLAKASAEVLHRDSARGRDEALGRVAREAREPLRRHGRLGEDDDLPVHAARRVARSAVQT